MKSLEIVKKIFLIIHMEHKLKIEKRWFDRILEDEKKCELRKNDRDFQVGDLITFIVSRIEEGDDGNYYRIPPYQRDEKFVITHVLTSDMCEGLKNGYCVLSITEIQIKPRK